VDAGLIAVIALIALGGGAVILLLRQRTPGWSITALRRPEGLTPGDNGVTSPFPDAAGPPSRREAAVAAMARATPNARLAVPDLVQVRQHRAPLHPDPEAVPDESIAPRLNRLDERLVELQLSVVRQRDEARADLERLAAALQARAEADRVRQEGALERLRTDLLAALLRAAGPPSASRARRPEVCAELYAKLARLEAALAAVTNPVLLPGEIYAPPGELLPEALVWDNWKEVGERVFALAELFSVQRLHLSEQTRGELAAAVTTLRELLTESVYPNLQAHPSPSQQSALREALVEIAVAITSLRGLLEREYGAEEAD
jgi:hypothetical protein